MSSTLKAVDGAHPKAGQPAASGDNESAAARAGGAGSKRVMADGRYLGGELVPAIARRLSEDSVVAHRLFREGKYPLRRPDRGGGVFGGKGPSAD